MAATTRTTTSGIIPPGLPVARKDTAANHASFTGQDGEITIVSDNGSLRIHDGSTAGGNALNVSSGTSLDGAVFSTGAVTIPETAITSTASLFVANHRIAVKASTGSVFYIPVSDTAW